LHRQPVVVVIELFSGTLQRASIINMPPRPDKMPHNLLPARRAEFAMVRDTQHLPAAI